MHARGSSFCTFLGVPGLPSTSSQPVCLACQYEEGPGMDQQEVEGIFSSGPCCFYAWLRSAYLSLETGRLQEMEEKRRYRAAVRIQERPSSAVLSALSLSSFPCFRALCLALSASPSRRVRVRLPASFAHLSEGVCRFLVCLCPF